MAFESSGKLRNIEGNEEFIHITPNITDLLPDKKIKCSFDECSKIFLSNSNLQMHLIKHHKRKLSLKNKEIESTKLYFCPIISCKYHELSTNKKYFKNLKYLRQHYQKVHFKKLFKCDKCCKLFNTEKLKLKHVSNLLCYSNYECNECGWTYSSKEALLTHCKRKNHEYKVYSHKKNSDGIKSEIKSLKLVKCNLFEIEPKLNDFILPSTKINNRMENKFAQTDSMNDLYSQQELKQNRTRNKNNTKFNKITTTTNEYYHSSRSPPKNKFTSFYNYNNATCRKTSNLNEITIRKINTNTTENQNNLNYIAKNDFCVDKFVYPVVTSFQSTETQTEKFYDLANIENAHAAAAADVFFDQMLYSNTHTQTCDDFLCELGLTDIQTQTNWSTNKLYHHQNIDKPSNIKGPHDELLVSTETQTSFTQYLLDSNYINNGNKNISKNSSSNGITQCTQTCDLLLGIFDGSQDDMISNFNSIHTQT